MFGGLSASALEDPTETIASLTTEASNSAGSIVQTTTSKDGQFEANISSGQVSIDSTAGGGAVQISPNEGDRVSIALPAETNTLPAQTVSDGTVVLQGNSGSADVSVQVLEDGFRVATVIGDATQSTRYTYSFDDGLVPVLEEDGSVTLTKTVAVTNPETDEVVDVGASVGQIAQPWALDNNGATVDTHYEVDGSTLTQVVEHQVDGIAYPVVADPVYTYSWPNANIWFNKAETQTIASGGWGAAAITAVCVASAGPVAGAACFAAAGSIVYAAGVAHNSGKCMTIRMVNYVGEAGYPSAYSYNSSYCR